MDIQRRNVLLDRNLNGPSGFYDSSNRIWVLSISGDVSATIAVFDGPIIQ